MDNDDLLDSVLHPENLDTMDDVNFRKEEKKILDQILEMKVE